MHYAVIGAGFGDEGKGLMTDYLCRKLSGEGSPPLNVRFNGGAQAGHTVVTEHNRHVFSHIGSGTYRDSTTYLSQDFIVNPLMLIEEVSHFKKLPSVIIHPHARVSTVFDVVLNRIKEEIRGGERHGSCGMGINETVTRHAEGYELRAMDLLDLNAAGSALKDIYEYWFLPQLNILRESANKSFNHYVDLATVANEMEIISKVNGYFGVCEMAIPQHEQVVFEGAQGLELDEELGVMPHCTRSVTGLIGALKAADELNAKGSIQPIYVTRCYKTRHGAGPLRDEHTRFIDGELVDKTNTTSEWQGEFRYAPLNLLTLEDYISMDQQRAIDYEEVTKNNLSMSPVIALTHLDQVNDKIGIINLKNEFVWVTSGELIGELNNIAPVRFASYGERAEDVVEL